MIPETTIIKNKKILVMRKHSKIGDFCFINCGTKLEIGKGSHINSGSKVIGGGELIIGEYVAITYDVILITGTDRYTGYMCDKIPEHSGARDITRGKIVIHDHAYIGSKSIIMPNVTIGEKAVVGAFSYVGKNVHVPSNEVWWGIPAKFQRKREIDKEKQKNFEKWYGFHLKF